MTAARRPAARRYPRDLSTGTRVLVRMMTARGPRPVPGTVTELEKVRGGYRVAVELDGGDRTHWTQAANAKLTLAPRA